MNENISQDLLINNRYRLTRKLGEGSFGEVWLSEDTLLDNQQVAIKFYQRTDTAGQQAFMREYTRVQHLHHDNLLNASYFDIYQRRPYLVMDYCPNGAARNYRGNMSEEQLWQFAHDVAAGLAYMHSQKPPLIHQDIKPDNVLIHATGRFVITDFGISRSALSASGSSESLKSAGTTAYMGPERFTSNPETIMASDVWSLGASLYELATGNQPFPGSDGNGMGGVAFKLGFEMPELPSTFSRDLNNMVQACMARETWDRPMAKEVEEYAGAKMRHENPRAPWAKKMRSISGVGKKKNNVGVKWIIGTVAVAVLASVLTLVFVHKDRDVVYQDPETMDTTAVLTDIETRFGTWTGTMKDGKPHGEGTMTYYKNDPDGRASYTGQMTQGKRNGKGILRYTTGNEFEGTFDMDNLVEGKFSSPADGIYYKGTFRDNMPYTGSWFYTDGTFYSAVEKGKEK